MGKHFYDQETFSKHIEMIRLALGTAQFGMRYGIVNQTGQISLQAAKDMLNLAKVSGVNTLDTAIAYGESEASLGKVGVSDFRIVTKLPGIPEGTADVSSWISEQLSNSCDRLKVDTLDAVLLHRPEQLLGSDGRDIYKALQRLRDKGLFTKIGISVYAPEELAQIIPRYQLDIVQAPLNLVDRRFVTSGWLARLKNDAIEVHTRSAFLQGLLLQSAQTLPAKFTQWSGLWDYWRQWLSDHGQSALRTSLIYPLSFSEIDRVVVGADSDVQLMQIISAASYKEPLDFPNLQCDDQDLINPARWS